MKSNNGLYMAALVVFAVLTLVLGEYSWQLAAGEGVFILTLFIYTRIASRHRDADLLAYIENVTSDIDSASQNTMQSFPLPMVIFTVDTNEILYANDAFMSATGETDHLFSVSISDVVPDFNARWLMDGKNEYHELITLGERRYRVFGTLVRGSGDVGVSNFMASTYWVDETDFAKIRDEFNDTRVVFSIILFDNYEEIVSGMSEKEKSSLISDIDDKIADWSGHCGGYIVKVERDRYIFIFEERYLEGYRENKFSVLDSVREIVTAKGMHPTISIGIGKDGKNIAENYQYASLGLEMSLSRGGDQAVIKNKFSFEFFGGRTAQGEKRTKVKSRVMAGSLTEIMRDSSNVFVMGHKQADLDSVGSAVGVCCAARALNRKAQIVIDLDNNLSKPLIERLVELPEYKDAFISPQDAILTATSTTLLVVVDTNRPEQVESLPLLESCNHVAVIDHHRRAATYIQNAALSLHEPYASSASELVTELLQYMVDQNDILRYEAEALLSGIMLDTKNFTLRTGGRTFDAAAFLRRAGADTTEVKTLLQSDLHTVVSRYSIIERARIYKSGIAIAAPESVDSKIIAAQAADELLNVSGIQASFVVFPIQDEIDISARSVGEVNVQLILEKLGGGGNQATAGAQIRDRTQKEVCDTLLNAIDSYLEDNAEE